MIIELSDGFMAGLPARMFVYQGNVYYVGGGGNAGYSTSGLLVGNPLQAGNAGYMRTQLILYKGIPPTDFSTITAYNSRSAEALVYFETMTADFSPSQTNINPAIITTILKNASATGVASWFRLQNYDTQVGIYTQLAGTIGSIGSGMDLEMDNVNIVAGSPYRVTNMRIQFPSTFTCS